MASISSLTGSSSSSSIYGTRNVISGLASGLDTESLIENVVSGYKTKLTQLQQSRTKVEWKQEMYRSIISKMSGFLSNYASYSSTNNLMSRSFFTNSVNVSTNGKYADKVTASGKTSSDVKLLGVKQLATAARYTVSGSNLNKLLTTNKDNTVSAAADESFSLDGSTTVGTLKGTLTLKYGSTSVELEFDQTEQYKSAEELKSAIEDKLEEASLKVGSSTYKASDKIKVNVSSGGTISFEEIGNAGNGVSIKSAGGTLGAVLGIDTSDSKNLPKSFTVSNAGALTETGSTADYLAGGKLSITLDGVTKTIELPAVEGNADNANEAFVNGLQTAIDKAFGEGKLTVDNAVTDGSVQLRFTTEQAGSTFTVTAKDSTVRSALGLSSTGLSSSVDTSKTLEDLLGVDADGKLDGLTPTGDTDEDGNELYAFKLNGVTIGNYTKDTALSTIMSAINSNAEAGVSVTYSKATNQFQFTAKETGAVGQIDFGEEKSLAAQLFGGGTATAGQDAILSMEVNGVKMENITRSTNSVEVDGLTMNLKGTFGYDEPVAVDGTTGVYEALTEQDVTNYYGNTITAKYVDAEGYYVSKEGTRYQVRDENGTPILDADGNVQYYKGTAKAELTEGTEPVTFTTSVDTEKIVDVVKQMVEDYNAMVTEIKTAYSTMPEQNSSGEYYQPLTDEDKADMSESSIKSYEEKAKAGLLFADRDLSNLYSRILNTLNGVDLESVGITLNYSDGLTTMKLNEDELTAALENDADAVADVFAGNGSTTGLITTLKSPLEAYGKTTGTKGILVEKAGSTLAPSTLYSNQLYSELGDIDDEIDKVQDKISDQIDYYTTKFTYLEQLIAQMNNQSSMLMGLSGGY